MTVGLTMVFGLLGLTGIPGAHAADDIPVTVAKTFEYATLIEHTLTAQRGPFQAALHLRQRRLAEDSPTIIRSTLAYQYDTDEASTAMPAEVFDALLTDLTKALHEHFGSDLKLESLVSGGFLGVKAIEKRSLLAFADYQPWQRYLKNPNEFSQLEIHTLVRKKWATAGVFAPVAAALAPLGYTATFSGFEKLFVFPAEKCSFYPEMALLGIRASERFPYPGSVSFTLAPLQ